MTTDYKPIACDAYDYIEIFAMHQTEVKVTAADEHGQKITYVGKIVDTSIHDSAEYLVLQSLESRLEIRLDRIYKIYNIKTRLEWSQSIDEPGLGSTSI